MGPTWREVVLQGDKTSGVEEEEEENATMLLLVIGMPTVMDELGRKCAWNCPSISPILLR
jgi:hypothetical protein